MHYLHIMDAADKNIPGIYNYCDRWCERCAFTGRCAVYEMSEETEAAAGGPDAPEFWEALHKNLAGTVNMIHEMMKAQGMDPEALLADDSNLFAEKWEASMAAAANNPLHLLATAYMESALQFFENNPVLEHKANDRLLQPSATIQTGHAAAPPIIKVGDCLDVIQWYIFFISTKIGRALNGKIEAAGEEPDDEFPPDYDGSAKVALIAIDRSMSAWALLLQHFPAMEDDILPLLVSLEKMKLGMEREFPNAQGFIRPGFDE
jgi:hypothetical protein